MTKQTVTEAAIEAVKRKYPRSNSHVNSGKKQIFGIDVIQVKYDESDEQKTRYVAILKDRQEVFVTIFDFMEFINANSKDLGVGKSNWLQMLFDNTESVLAFIVTLAFVGLLVFVQSSTLIDLLKLVLGLVFGTYFGSKMQKGRK